MRLLGRFIRHLRLKFQMVLAPVFLLGYLLGSGPIGARFIGVFLLVHIGLYGGMTAYNSYWDRDEGPIGGMKKPPPVGAGEHWGGLAIQIVSVLVMGWLDWVLGAGALLLFVLGVAYSHPRWRLKARPWASLLTVTLGQGLLPFFMGLYTVPHLGHQLGGGALWTAAGAAALLVTGLYPLTQVYQIEEDSKRGDRTFAVRYGPQRVFVLAVSLMGAGVGLVALLVSIGVFERFWLMVLPLVYVGFCGALWLWWRRFYQQDTYDNHDWAFRISACTASGFWVFVGLEFYFKGLYPF
jgi:4-hydroxybenzoate polyprenyltransferase